MPGDVERIFVIIYPATDKVNIVRVISCPDKVIWDRENSVIGRINKIDEEQVRIPKGFRDRSNSQKHKFRPMHDAIR